MKSLLLLLLLIITQHTASATSGLCESCEQVTIPICDCPASYTCVTPSGRPTPSFPECTRVPEGYLSPVPGDRIPPIPCPSGHFCPYGLPIPLPCRSGSYCSSSRAFPLLQVSALLASLLLLTLARPLFSCITSSRASAPSTLHSQTEPQSVQAEDDDAWGPYDPNEGAAAGGLEVQIVGGGVVAGKKQILEAVSGSFRPASLTAIMGPSGAGKTSLLRALRGSVKLSAGTVRINGRKATLSKIASRVGYVPQDDDTLDPSLTVETALLASSLLRRPMTLPWNERKAAVSRVLHDVMLSHVRNVRIGSGSDDMAHKTLSGGERKRVNIGYELVSNPALLLCDEPTTGLDELSSLAIVRCLKRSSRTHGATVLATIHQPSQHLFELFDDVVFLKDGRIVYWGPVGDVGSHFGTSSPDAILDIISSQSSSSPPPLHSSPTSGLDRVTGEGASLESSSGPPMVFQILVQIWRVGMRWALSTRELAGLLVMFAATGIFLGLAFVEPKYVLPPPSSVLDSCPYGAVQLTQGQKWSQPCSSDWPTSETQGLFVMYACMMLGVLGAAYGVMSLSSSLPVYWRQVASGSSRIAYFTGIALWDSALCGGFAASFVVTYAFVANPWGSLSKYVSLVFWYLWTTIGIGYMGGAWLSQGNGAILVTLATIVISVFSGLAFQRVSAGPPIYTFYFSQALWQVEAQVAISNTGPGGVGSIASYADSAYGYHIDEGVVAHAYWIMLATGSLFRLLAFFGLFLRHRRKQK